MFESGKSVELNQTTLTLEVGKSQTLTATISPDRAENKTVVWTSSNPAVASVVNGLVTALSQGTTTITATTIDGNKTASCEIKVVDPNDPNTPMPGDVYIAGSVGNAATIWKNGVAHKLTDGTTWGGNSLFGLRFRWQCVCSGNGSWCCKTLEKWC